MYITLLSLRQTIREKDLSMSTAHTTYTSNINRLSCVWDRNSLILSGGMIYNQLLYTPTALFEQFSNQKMKNLGI